MTFSSYVNSRSIYLMIVVMPRTNCSPEKATSECRCTIPQRVRLWRPPVLPQVLISVCEFRRHPIRLKYIEHTLYFSPDSYTPAQWNLQNLDHIVWAILSLRVELLQAKWSTFLPIEELFRTHQCIQT